MWFVLYNIEDISFNFILFIEAISCIRLCVEEYGILWWIVCCAVLTWNCNNRMWPLSNELFNINHHSIPLYMCLYNVVLNNLLTSLAEEKRKKNSTHIHWHTFTRTPAYSDKFQDFVVHRIHQISKRMCS